MNCKKIYTHDFLFEKCTSTFLNKEFKKHREEVLLNQQKISLDICKYFVLDEADRMLDLGFDEEVHHIIDKIYKHI